ncbi:anti-sigma-D factor RsdA [Mycobacterium sp.]|uniref:anti-sigma-D factor RsdA n=1 Tax=Mycobacterium sp. TaxID=1785 RepID=UPI003D6BCA84
MSDFGRTPFDQPDLVALARSDRLLDALATRRPVESGDFGEPGDQVLAALLADWRDELRWPPASGLVSERQATAALERGWAARRHARGGLTLVGSVAAAVLALGGFGALVGGAQPGDALYGVRTMLFDEPPSVHDDRIALTAKTELEQVQQMITQGQWDQAQTKLAAVTDNVQTVNDEGRKQDLIDQVNQLNAKVTARDPNAPVPPSSQPGAAPATTATPASVSPTPSDPMTSTTLSPASVSTTAVPVPAATSTAPDSATPTSVPPGAATAPSTSPAAASSAPLSSSTPTSATASSSSAASSSAGAPTATTTAPTTSDG